MLRNLAKKIPLVRGLTHTVCPYHTGSVIENKLGSHVVRVAGKHIAWFLRRSRVVPEIKDFIEILKRDGVLVIPDFLSESQFLQVREEFDRSKSKLEFSKFQNASNGRLMVTSSPVNDEDDGFTHTRNYLQGSLAILQIASAVIRRRITSKPGLTINLYRKSEDSEVDNDIENILHADLHTATVKAFYYLNDIDESNGAFIYAKGSHKFSLNRLRHEYDMSVRTAKLKTEGNDIPGNLLAVRGSRKRSLISECYMRKMNIKETSICGKANTLVIANNMGFHRRGEFTSERPRETILINFRHLERPFI